jgi:hypothetical protein
MSQSGFSQSGRPIKEDMIQGFASAFGCGNGDAQIFFYPGLSDEIIQTSRSETGLQNSFIIG